MREGVRLKQPLQGTAWRFCRAKQLPSNTAVSLLDICPEKTRIQKDTCTSVFTGDMETTLCPSAEEWIKKMWYTYTTQYSVQFSSVAQLCPTLCDPMNRSTPGLPVHHQLPESTQTHVHRVSDAIQPSHLLSSPSHPAPNPSQHQGLFQ